MRREELYRYLLKHRSITKGEAEEKLGMNKNAFWSAVRQLRDRGFHFTVFINRADANLTKCILEDKVGQVYSKKNNPRLYAVWKSMRSRCQRISHKSYLDYGGRGISVCSEWNDGFQYFAEWAMANGYDESASHMQCTLDRIDNDGNYEPNNCRFVSMKIQCNNRRRGDSHERDKRTV